MKPVDSNLPTSTDDSSFPAERVVRQKSNERAFVVQFDPIEHWRSRLHGRVELVASGEHTRFRSLKELVAFMVRTLRRRTTSHF